MRKVVHKLFWVWQFDKEEKWLNEMVAKGLCLVSVGLCRYEFEDCLPGEYKIRMELLENSPRSVESSQYISFIEETGVEQVGSCMRWVYFRKKAAEGPFELFSDNDSRINHLTRIIRFMLSMGVANLIVGFYNLFLCYYWQSELNFLGIVNLVVCVFLAVGSFGLMKKRRRLRTEQLLFG